jgi:hypothetical protein
MKAMIPSYGQNLNDKPELLEQLEIIQRQSFKIE